MRTGAAKNRVAVAALMVLGATAWLVPGQAFAETFGQGAAGDCGDAGEATEFTTVVGVGVDVARAFCGGTNGGFPADEDVLQFNAEAGKRYRVEVTPGAALAGIRVGVAENTFSVGPWWTDSDRSAVRFPVLTAGVQRFVVAADGLAEGTDYPYTVRIREFVDPQPVVTGVTADRQTVRAGESVRITAALDKPAPAGATLAVRGNTGGGIGRLRCPDTVAIAEGSRTAAFTCTRDVDRAGNTTTAVIKVGVDNPKTGTIFGQTQFRLPAQV